MEIGLEIVFLRGRKKYVGNKKSILKDAFPEIIISGI